MRLTNEIKTLSKSEREKEEYIMELQSRRPATNDTELASDEHDFALIKLENQVE